MPGDVNNDKVVDEEKSDKLKEPGELTPEEEGENRQQTISSIEEFLELPPVEEEVEEDEVGEPESKPKSKGGEEEILEGEIKKPGEEKEEELEKKAKEEEPEKKGEEEVKEEPAEVDARDALVERLSAELLGRTPAVGGEKKKEVEKEGKPPEEPVVKDDGDLLIKDERQLSEMLSDPTLFNQFISRLNARLSEGVLTAVPGTVETVLKRAFELRDKGVKFYSKNPDLAPNSQYVTFVTRKARSEHPEWTDEQVLEEVETRVRTALRKPRSDTPPAGESESEPRTKGGKPAFANVKRGGPRHTSPPQRTQVQKDIDDIISDV